MRSDDLVPLFTAPNAGKGVGFRQGVIVAWDQETAENSVLVGDSLLDNLPILNTSEAAILAVGDVVGILTAGSTWGILGRFTIPGTPEAVSALSSLRTASDTEPNLDTITSTTFVDAATNPGPSVDITVGPTGRLLVFVSCNLESNATGTAGNTYKVDAAMSFALTGANTLAASIIRGVTLNGDVTITSSASTFLLQGAVTKVVYLEGLNRGLTTLTAKYRKGTASTPTSARFFDRNLTAMAL